MNVIFFYVKNQKHKSDLKHLRQISREKNYYPVEFRDRSLERRRKFYNERGMNHQGEWKFFLSERLIRQIPD